MNIPNVRGDDQRITGYSWRYAYGTARGRLPSDFASRKVEGLDVIALGLVRSDVQHTAKHSRGTVLGATHPGCPHKGVRARIKLVAVIKGSIQPRSTIVSPCLIVEALTLGPTRCSPPPWPRRSSPLPPFFGQAPVRPTPGGWLSAGRSFVTTCLQGSPGV